MISPELALRACPAPQVVCEPQRLTAVLDRLLRLNFVNGSLLSSHGRNALIKEIVVAGRVTLIGRRFVHDVIQVAVGNRQQDQMRCVLDIVIVNERQRPLQCNNQD